MKKFSDERMEEHADLTRELREAFETLESAIEDYEEAVNDAYATLDSAFDDYNNVAYDVERWREGVVMEMREYRETRPKTWGNTNVGARFERWLSAWEDQRIDQADPPESPDTYGIAPEDVCDDFEALPDDVEEMDA